MNDDTLSRLKEKALSSRAWVVGGSLASSLAKLEGWPLAGALVGITAIYVISETLIKVLGKKS